MMICSKYYISKLQIEVDSKDLDFIYHKCSVRFNIGKRRLFNSKRHLACLQNRFSGNSLIV
jgi:hypothetical protein